MSLICSLSPGAGCCCCCCWVVNKERGRQRMLVHAEPLADNPGDMDWHTVPGGSRSNNTAAFTALLLLLLLLTSERIWRPKIAVNCSNNTCTGCKQKRHPGRYPANLGVRGPTWDCMLLPSTCGVRLLLLLLLLLLLGCCGHCWLQLSTRGDNECFLPIILDESIHKLVVLLQTQRQPLIAAC